MQDGILVTRAWYRCESCENCPQRERCCRKQDINAPKEVIWKKTFWEKREDSLRNITSDRGIMLRMNRSIQVEGAFGLLKNDFSFRRFMTTGKRNIRIELFFLALGFNLKKRWMKQQKSRLETHYSEKKASQPQNIKKLSTGRPGNMPRSALLCLKIEIWAVNEHLRLELECSRRKNWAAAKKNFATVPGLHIRKILRRFEN